MYKIITELNENNGANYKLDVLKKHKTNELLKRVLKMTYDKAAITYGISMKNVPEYKNPEKSQITLTEALDVLERRFATRLYTGHEALAQLTNLFNALDAEDSKVLEGVINRDLRINMGRSQINKVFKDLITKPIYMRCDTYSEDHFDKAKGKMVKGTCHNINFEDGALLQLKADGTFREFHVSDTITCNSRSGEEYEYPKIFNLLKDVKHGTYIGELTVKLNEALLNKILPKLKKSDKKNGTTDADDLVKKFLRDGEFILPRSIGNGLIKSDDVPHDNLVLDLWDYITPEEYGVAALKDKKNPCTIPYMTRFTQLVVNLDAIEDESIDIVETHEVKNLSEALTIVSKWMEHDLEGGILKDKSGLFKDGTSKHQLKLKLEIECDVRITGFTEGTGKNEAYFGAVTFENDEGTIKGRVGVSSMTEELRDWFHAHREDLIGKIMEVQFNDLSKARGHDYYALSHPRFIELREDKDTPDTLEKVFENKRMAITLEKKK